MNMETLTVLTCLSFSDRELQIARNMCKHKISGWRVVIEALVFKNFPLNEFNFEAVQWKELCEQLTNDNEYGLQISSNH